jgi:mercuric ion transport protein
MRVQLIYFSGCPRVDTTRQNLRRALEATGVQASIEEIDTSEPNTPPALKRWGSPTVLINGVDALGQPPGSEEDACRLYEGAEGASGGIAVETLRAAVDRAKNGGSRGAGRETLYVTGSAVGAIGAAGLAALSILCCAGPAVLAVLGTGGAIAAAGLGAYRPHFVVASIAFLGLGFWRSYRAVSNGACSIRTGRLVRAVLWSSLVVSLTAFTLPYLFS